jgi:hypothetical protein
MRTHARRSGNSLTSVADGVVAGSIDIQQLQPSPGPSR